MEQHDHHTPSEREHLTLQPTAPAERMSLVDILRGVAVFGILVVNMGSFKASTVPYMPTRSSSWLDRWTDALINFLFEGKFYPIFAFLFGWGVAWQMERLQARGANPVSLMVRRLMVLLFIGLAHAILVWSGDILFFYALGGMVLLLFRRLQPRALLALALSVWGIQVFCCGVPIGLFLAMQGVPEAAAGMQQANEQFASAMQQMISQAEQVYSQGSYLEALRHRVKEWFQTLFWAYLALLPNALSMFWLGMYAAKGRLLENVASLSARWRVVTAVCLVVGAVVNVFYARQLLLAPPQLELAPFLGAFWLYLLGGPLLGVGYVLALSLWLGDEGRRVRFGWLAAVGRMALTNYLLQSVVCTLLFYHYGLGLYGKVGVAAGLALSCVLFAAQAVFSVWWLRRYRFGPAEWLWRTLTYGQRQPMRVG
ncbi:MAG: DUF418 domain-containing protein [bacterium]|nr:DUF418 domain-containing protein [bacterium]MCS7310308.1 DUF418 domain-containing protein [Armatimonadota bacterium]MDW8104701.1 DUF418 domain-containing protein [Armatimonadota bacterium]